MFLLLLSSVLPLFVCLSLLCSLAASSCQGSDGWTIIQIAFVGMEADEGSSSVVLQPVTGAAPAAASLEGDVFEKEDFDAVGLVNKLFPNGENKRQLIQCLTESSVHAEASLASLDDLVNGLKRKVKSQTE